MPSAYLFLSLSLSLSVYPYFPYRHFPLNKHTKWHIKTTFRSQTSKASATFQNFNMGGEIQNKKATKIQPLVGSSSLSSLSSLHIHIHKSKPTYYSSTITKLKTKELLKHVQTTFLTIFFFP